MDLISNISGGSKFAISPEELAMAEGEDNVKQKFLDFISNGFQRQFAHMFSRNFSVESTTNVAVVVNNANICLVPDAEDATQGLCALTERVSVSLWSAKNLFKINVAAPSRIIFRPVAECIVTTIENNKKELEKRNDDEKSLDELHQQKTALVITTKKKEKKTTRRQLQFLVLKVFTRETKTILWISQLWKKTRSNSKNITTILLIEPLQTTTTQDRCFLGR